MAVKKLDFSKSPMEMKINEVADQLDISKHLARELLILAGGDEEIVVDASLASRGLDQCKARILDMRLCTIEQELFSDVQYAYEEVKDE